MMEINAKKTSYMIFTRAHYNFSTRLIMNNITLDKVKEAKIVGVWLTADLKWKKNTKELAKRAYSKLSMLSKLKYVGVSITDLTDV